jgi:hypothetical protein
MTAEQLKAALREYSDEHYPGWTRVSLFVRSGVGEMLVEMVIRPDDGSTASTSAPLAAAR